MGSEASSERREAMDALESRIDGLQTGVPVNRAVRKAKKQIAHTKEMYNTGGWTEVDVDEELKRIDANLIALYEEAKKLDDIEPVSEVEELITAEELLSTQEEESDLEEGEIAQPTPPLGSVPKASPTPARGHPPASVRPALSHSPHGPRTRLQHQRELLHSAISPLRRSTRD